MSSSLFSAIFDSIPTDYIPPKLNSSVMSINYLNRSNTPYSNGKKLTNGTISQNTAYLRYNYGSQIQDYPTSYGIAVPISDIKTNGETLSNIIGKESKGLNDIVFNSTIWLKADKKNKEYFALTFILVTPTGEYDEKQLLNVGENRYKYVLNAGYISPISEKVFFEVVPEIAFYGDNKSSTKNIEQKPSFAINTNLRYKINTSYQVFTGYQYSYNSETKVDNIEQNNDFSSNKYSIGMFYFTEKFNQFMIRYAKEDDKKFGMKIDDEFLIRYRWWF
jgi:hypothetical protein